MDPNVRKYFSQEARDYLAEHSDDIDKRLGYLIPVGFKIGGQKLTQARGKKMYRGGLKLKGFSKMVKKAKGGEELAETYEADAKERARQYDAIEGYVRNPAEAPNHAEGGMYKSFSGEGAGKLRIDEYVNKAIQQYNSKNPRDAMYTLSLALHTTQDKGAHGEGAPGTGHDPRKFFPPPNHYAKTGWVYWQKGKGKYPNLEFSSCDNIDQNPRGLQIAQGATHNTLRQFVEGIGVHDRRYGRAERRRPGQGGQADQLDPARVAQPHQARGGPLVGRHGRHQEHARHGAVRLGSAGQTGSSDRSAAGRAKLRGTYQASDES